MVSIFQKYPRGQSPAHYVNSIHVEVCALNMLHARCFELFRTPFDVYDKETSMEVATGRCQIPSLLLSMFLCIYIYIYIIFFNQPKNT